MPGRDQTGPLGMGAQTGTRRGLCSHNSGGERRSAPENGKGQGMGPRRGQGMGPGKGQGMGPGMGQGNGPGRGQGNGPGRGRSMNGQGVNRHGIHGFDR